MEITGKIIAVLPPKQGVSQSTGNAWMCQDYVLETQEMYPKKVCFNVFGAEKIQEMNIQLGEMLTVSLEINANEYQGKWFNQVRGWKVVRVPVQGQQQAQVPPQGCQVVYPDRQPAQAPQQPAQQPPYQPPQQTQTPFPPPGTPQDDGQLPF